MKFILRGRQEGKTTELINFLVDNPDCIMFVETLHSVKRLQRLYPNLKERIFAVNSLNFLKFPYRTKAVLDNYEFYDKEKFRHLLDYYDVLIVTSTL